MDTLRILLLFLALLAAGCSSSEPAPPASPGQPVQQDERSEVEQAAQLQVETLLFESKLRGIQLLIDSCYMPGMVPTTLAGFRQFVITFDERVRAYVGPQQQAEQPK